MPWRTYSSVSDSRRSFLEGHAAGVPFDLLCGAHGIKKSAAYALLRRAREQGFDDALVERSRATRTHPNAISVEVRERVLVIRGKYPWGPKKLRALYINAYGVEGVPSESSIANILKQAACTRPHRRRKVHTTSTCALTEARAVNDVWAVDHKGPMRRLASVEPLNAIDHRSRFWVGCAALIDKSYKSTRTQFEGWFDSYGAPSVIRVDAGSPWVSVSAPLGITQLSAWWLTMGIRMEVAPCCQLNGIVERLHGTMASDMDVDGVVDIRAHLDEHRRIYNDVRPHESLGQRVPSSVFVPGQKPVERVYRPSDDACDEQRRVTTDGSIQWKGTYIFVSTALEGRIVGLRQLRPLVWSVRFYGHELGTIAGEKFRATPTLGVPMASGLS